MQRVSLNVTGAQGQGVNSVGEMCARGLKRLGYCVFGYREYSSLIKGGHSSYQLDVSSTEVRSSSRDVDLLVCFNHYGLSLNLHQVREGGIIIHQTPQWKFTQEQQAVITKQSITVLFLPTEEILQKIGGKTILGNVLITSVVWALLGLKAEQLKELVRERFGHKKELLALNEQCIDEGTAFASANAKGMAITLPTPNPAWSDALLLTGSQALGLGTIAAGVRVFAGYPMTPSSPLLSALAEMQNETGMVIKQAEDEITAVQMAAGAMFMGTRALTTTSGGGFDLMTETVSLCGITETPLVVILAQRPGPGTGLPTWTAQGDLLLAIHSAHGEFPRCVMAVSDSEDSFSLVPAAFNIADRFQTPVILLTDKQLAEAIYTQSPYSLESVTIDRGKLVTDAKVLTSLKPTDRYDPHAEGGVSLRWKPGDQAPVFCGQGDEHTSEGGTDESAKNASEQMQKRLKKAEALAASLSEPDLWIADSHGNLERTTEDPKLDLLIVGWGSIKGMVLDALLHLQVRGQKIDRIGYLHYTYLWPLKTDRFALLQKNAKQAVAIEQNATGQLRSLLLPHAPKPLQFVGKDDGRPFFREELSERIATFLPSPKAAAKKSSPRSSTRSA